MKEFIRTCLSLNEKTRQLITEMSEISGRSKSETVKMAVKYFHKYLMKIMK